MLLSTTVSLQQNTISAEYARWLQHNYNIPIPANKCSIQNKHALLNKSNLPLGQCRVFLQGQYPNKIWSIPWKVTPCPLKERSVHFQMSNPPFNGAVPLLEKSIFLHNICSIIDIEHPFQKCNIFETVSTIIKECSFASYHWTTEYCPVWQKNPVKKQHSWKTRFLLFDMCTLPLGQISPAFIKTTLT